MKHIAVNLPSVMSIDVLETLSDDALHERVKHLYLDRDKARAARLNTQQWEVEICYANRERDLRNTRKSLHTQYLQDLIAETAELQKLEETYPIADLDNSEFIFNNDD